MIMLPHTHFLAGLLIGLTAVKLGIINIPQALLIAVLTTSIDLDHLIASYKKFKTWSLTKCWNASMKGQIKRSVIHSRKGFLVITLVSLVIYNFLPAVGFILLSAYITHYILDILGDFVKGKAEKRIKFTDIIVHLNFYELALDIIIILLLFL